MLLSVRLGWMAPSTAWVPEDMCFCLHVLKTAAVFFYPCYSVFHNFYIIRVFLQASALCLSVHRDVSDGDGRSRPCCFWSS